MENRLVELNKEEWCQLRDLYNNQRQYCSSYNFLQNSIDWIEQNEEVDIKIYTLNGEWRTDGTFLAKMGYFIIFNTLDDTDERLLKALNCLDKEQLYRVAGCRERFNDTVRKFFLNCGLEYKPDATAWVTIAREEALRFDIESPKDLQLKRLNQQHAEQINNVWPHRFPDSVEYIKRLILYNESVGVFDINEHLMAWCLIAPLGCMTILHVEENYRRKGLGQLVVRYMSRLIARKGLEVTAPIVVHNVASRSLFEKLGFKTIDHVYWSVKPACSLNELK